MTCPEGRKIDGFSVVDGSFGLRYPFCFVVVPTREEMFCVLRTVCATFLEHGSCEMERMNLLHW